MADRASIEARLRTLPAFSVSRDSMTAGRPAWADAAAVARTLESLGARAALHSDTDWPRGLRDLADPPAALFLRGALPDRERAVAVVGSRAASPYGTEQARALASDLAGLGFTVVSGLARGIDAAAHRGALDAGGATVAVLPGGLDRVTPRHHRALAEE